jgi:ammonium transporter, Amt family
MARPGRAQHAAMFNAANTTFMLLASALVLLMTPGLAFFYGGLVGRKNTLTIMVQSFASMGVTTILTRSCSPK